MKPHGFTLIELMIVIGIISILASLALPSYQRYTQRARFTEVIATAQTYKTIVALALQEGIPLDELSSGFHGIEPSPEPTSNLASVEVENGIITAVGSPATDNATLILTPDSEGSHWETSGTCIEKGLCHG